MLHVAKAEPTASPSASAPTTAVASDDEEDDNNAVGVAAIGLAGLALIVAIGSAVADRNRRTTTT